MDSNSIRKKFLDFFQQRDHEIVDSAPMVVKNDPTLMFTNAGMNQFKDYFLGNKTPASKRVADTQKCLRVSGKHNDLEEVGLDTYHHTMFEMLGNWSFGDYFKAEAINWAWELLTKVYGLQEDRLYITYFGGDQGDGLKEDQEALDLWRRIVPEERIKPFGKKDNFWEMGDTGPCGPCSEIHYDLRADPDRAKVDGADLVNQDHPEVIEIWNLVFIQFKRLSSGALETLDQQHIDTGMGFERLVRAVQNKSSNYDTDLFQPIIKNLGDISGASYGSNSETDVAMRVIADHLRAVVFAISDGQLPSNTKAGYVIRRILRRAIRYGYTFLSLEQPFIYKLVPVLADQMTDIFPEVKGQQGFISKVIREEEQGFLRTLAQGLVRFQKYMSNLPTAEDISGEFAFELYDTYGFPLDLTELLAREQQRSVDIEEFQQQMQLQKQRSRAAQETESGDWVTLSPESESYFRGYRETDATSKVTKYRQVYEKGKNYYQLVLDQTPFYAESGGQVGDKGYLVADQNKVRVWDTKKENDLILHFVDQLPEPIDHFIVARVDLPSREATERNHSATHLLHAALRQVLGDHVQQKGSLVSPEILRFDFSHFSKVSADELQEIEMLVNAKIRENISRITQENIPLEEAREMGAMALFGEKYSDLVRVVSFDPGFSLELCGGTHVQATGQIGLFKIISESSVAAGVRRIEALTGKAAEQYVDEQLGKFGQIKELLKNPKDTVQAVEGLLREKAAMIKKMEAMDNQQLQQLKATLLESKITRDQINILVQQVKVSSAESLKSLSFQLKNEVDNLLAVLAADVHGKPQIAVVISEHLVEKHGWNASKLVRELATLIQGGGGGQPFFAVAGGKDLKGLGPVVEKAHLLLDQLWAEQDQST